MDPSKPNLAVLTPRSRMNEAQEELSRVVQTLVRIGEQFDQAIVDCTNETTLYKSRVAELERRNNENRTAVDDAVIQKLKRVKRVLRDLMEELPDDDEVSARSSPHRSTDRMRGGELRNASPMVSTSVVSPNFTMPRLEPSGVTQPSTPVVKLNPKPPSLPKSASPRASLRSRSPTSTLFKPPALSADESWRMSPSRVPRAVMRHNPHLPQSPPKALSPRVSAQNRSPTSTLFKSSTLSADENWRMSTDRTPRTARVTCPIPWQGLQERLGLPEDMVSSLESLSGMDDLCFRVHIVDDMAFIYEPFTMDCPSASLLLGWGTQSDNVLTARYITINLTTRPFFHTFILSGKKDTWYYIGAHTWTPINLFSVWSVMDGGVSGSTNSYSRLYGHQTKRKVVDRLWAHGHQKHTKEDIRQMLDDGHLVQFCVEVSSATLTPHSEAFAKRLDYQKST
ncbi:hypothetical protein F5141DRAFT_1216583 [Pisolithus sp. B1]|nr:hypothetical protein F5141DRAFT_1216583 [Pisolithus sp. B1]